MEAATTTGDDDDVYFWHRIKLLEGKEDFTNSLIALHVGVDYLKLHLWPAKLRILEYIFLGVRVSTCNQADSLRQKWQRLLARRVCEPLQN